jgi:outer membrane immunogenic protein
MNCKLIRYGVAAAMLIAMPIAAQAADLPAPSYKAPAYVAPSYSTWSGFYLGINGGYGFGKSTWDFPATSPDPKGALYGVTAGYNFQTGTYVWGIEGDYDLASIKGDDACGVGTCETKNDWLATARARLGYAGFANFMPYITGGAAFGKIKATNSITGEASKTKVGFAVGAGLEYMLFNNWSIKAEYLYVDLGKFDCGIACGAATDDVSYKANVVRAGLNYRF